MSARKFYLDLSALARRDFRDILSYTSQNWGGKQLTVYRNKINRALKAIVSNPTKSMEHTTGLYEFLVELHRIFYRVKGSTVYIVRILHHSMDTVLHLKGGD